MGRTVSAVVTWGNTYLGVIGPVPVSVPWWAEVEPVVAHLREVLGVPVLVLRLLLVEGGAGGRDGHVTYHVAALDRPAPGLLAERPPVDHAAHVSAGPGTWPRCSGCPPTTARSGSRPRPASRPTRPASSPHSPARTRPWCRRSSAPGQGGSCSSTCPVRTAGTRRRRSSPARSSTWPPPRRSWPASRSWPAPLRRDASRRDWPTGGHRSSPGRSPRCSTARWPASSAPRRWRRHAGC